MMINCEKASELTSKKLDDKLSFWERMTLKFHTLMCSTCALFEDEAKTITNSIHMHATKDESSIMSDNAKNKLQDLLNSKK